MTRLLQNICPGLLKDKSSLGAQDDGLLHNGGPPENRLENSALSFTPRAMPFLKNQTPPVMRAGESGKKKAGRIKKRTREISAPAFKELWLLRRATAAENGAPPCVLFSGQALAAICKTMPENDFIEIPDACAVKL